MRRREQVTCHCHEYEFPHRIGGGNCSGSAWAGSYFEIIRESCDGCSSNDNGICQVATGQEKIKYCDGVRDFGSGKGYNVKLPISLEEYLKKQEEKVFELAIELERIREEEKEEYIDEVNLMIVETQRNIEEELELSQIRIKEGVFVEDKYLDYLRSIELKREEESQKEKC